MRNADFLATFNDAPRRSSQEENAPPPMLPTSAIR